MNPIAVLRCKPRGRVQSGLGRLRWARWSFAVLAWACPGLTAAGHDGASIPVIVGPLRAASRDPIEVRLQPALTWLLRRVVAALPQLELRQAGRGVASAEGGDGGEDAALVHGEYRSQAGADVIQLSLLVRRAGAACEVQVMGTRSDLQALALEVGSGIAAGLDLELDDAARTALRHAPGTHPEAARALFAGLAASETDAGRARAFAEAVAADPSFAEAHYRLGVALAAASDPEGAWRALARAVELDPALAAARLAMAGERLRRHDIAGAEEQARLAVAAAPDDPATHVALGDVLRERAALYEAGRSYARALALDPGEVAALAALSLLEWRLGGRNPVPEEVPSSVALAPSPNAPIADQRAAPAVAGGVAGPPRAGPDLRSEIGFARRIAATSVRAVDLGPLLARAEAALAAGDPAGSYRALAELYAIEGIEGLEVSAASAQRASGDVPAEGPDPSGDAGGDGDREPVPMALVGGDSATSPGRDVGEVGPAEQAAQSALLEASRAVREPSEAAAALLAAAATALDAGDPATMYRRLAEYYQHAGLRYSAARAGREAVRLGAGE